jgi:hypothetical protein
MASMSWRRVRAKGGPPLKPFPKWSSLKVGDCVASDKFFWLLLKVQTTRHDYPNMRAQYSKRGLMLDLLDMSQTWVDLDDVGIRSEVIRGEGGA